MYLVDHDSLTFTLLELAIFYERLEFGILFVRFLCFFWALITKYVIVLFAHCPDLMQLFH